jgi:hypothetical protein
MAMFPQDTQFRADIRYSLRLKRMCVAPAENGREVSEQPAKHSG